MRCLHWHSLSETVQTAGANAVRRRAVRAAGHRQALRPSCCQGMHVTQGIGRLGAFIANAAGFWISGKQAARENAPEGVNNFV